MLTKEEKEILHKAGKILERECSNMKECRGCPLNVDNACHHIDSCDGFDSIGKALQKI